MPTNEAEPTTRECVTTEAVAAAPHVPVNPYWRVFRRMGPAGPLALVAASLPGLTGFAVLGLLSWIAPWLRAHPVEGMLVYIFGFTLVGGLAVLPTWAHSVLGGWAFGFRAGFPAAVASLLGGAIVGYMIGRLASGQRVVAMLEEHPKIRAVYDSLLRSRFGKSLLIVTLIRVPPSSPYAVTNLALACARVNPLVYVLGTLFGMAPRTGIVVFVSSRLSQLTFHSPHQRWMIAGGIVVTMIVLSIIGYLANQAIAQVTAPAKPDTANP